MTIPRSWAVAAADATARADRVTRDNVKLYEKIRCVCVCVCVCLCVCVCVCLCVCACVCVCWGKHVERVRTRRFLENFTRQGTGGGGGDGGDGASGGSGGGGGWARGTAAGGDDLEAPYKRLYEDTVSPFAAFNKCARAALRLLPQTRDAASRVARRACPDRRHPGGTRI